MELLFATPLRAWGGGEKWMLDAAIALRDRGHGVQLAAPQNAEICRRATRAGLPTLACPFRADFDPLSFGRIFRACRRREVDALVLNLDRALRVAGTAAKLAGVPVILPRRGSEFPLKNSLPYRLAYQKVATGVLVNSDATAKALLRGVDWKPTGKIHRLYNHLHLDVFENLPEPRNARMALDLEPDQFVLCSVGELTQRKDHATLLRAVARMNDPRMTVLIVGEGDQREALDAMAAELKIGAQVHLLGFREDIPQILAASDLYVHPAILEGFGFAVAEAMAAMLACVVSNASSLPEVIEAGRTGRLFPSGDAAALAQAITDYRDDPECRRAHGIAGARRVREHFEFNQQLDHLESILQEELRRARA